MSLLTWANFARRHSYLQLNGQTLALTSPADLGTQVMHKLWQSGFDEANFQARSMI